MLARLRHTGWLQAELKREEPASDLAYLLSYLNPGTEPGVVVW